ncbi:hypothetical protein BDA99DRAFT_573431 [Phascolomyces articulosus]|uniref:DUF4604 domain-containing protein n=1 Tax=Phascolomyces articulosus TaxID=60185 RepID=A0AAD5PC54_9FUNG|nr:hypothetical protein BDA99DRAFT_573431 [Phascolomyces articulosus]
MPPKKKELTPYQVSSGLSYVHKEAPFLARLKQNRESEEKKMRDFENMADGDDDEDYDELDGAQVVTLDKHGKEIHASTQDDNDNDDNDKKKNKNNNEEKEERNDGPAVDENGRLLFRSKKNKRKLEDDNQTSTEKESESKKSSKKKKAKKAISTVKLSFDDHDE